MSKYIPSERADSKYLPLTSEQITVLVNCYNKKISARDAAKAAGCASASVWRYWRMLREGETSKAHDPHGRKHRKAAGPKPGWGQGPRREKPLNNEARFYRSTFEPA